ncbi:hypothetical protein LTR78_006969 [Recurvomyces mirabilis]|uniref:Uncharacterized protein n=1 Tax=Recurvomyces mirabilis TaxID=574656 RepID=A0AAE1BZ23_9PEZI|nr:hypothetical protein LTR78_006969 [Recurvomyces mirabilis]KAK5153353.1 hypothetical protein LTS14_007522 [Recurvomyces mirabilis]
MAEQKPCLLSLPLELREMIWRDVLVEPEPIFTCLAQHAVTRPRDSSKRARIRAFWSDRYSRTPTAPETKVSLWPRLPTLSRVSAQLRREALEVFFRDNVFLFRLDCHMSDHDVQRWQDSLMAQWSPKMLGAHLFKSWTLRLEFMVQSQTGGMRQPTAIDCKLGAADRLLLSFSGALEQECTCRCRDGAEGLSSELATAEAGSATTLARFATLVEEQMKSDWERRGRRMTPPCPCVRCGLMRSEKRTPDELKRYSDQYWKALGASQTVMEPMNYRSGGRLVV